MPARFGRPLREPPSLGGEIVTLWGAVRDALFGSYHPEKHYMRGPGPACRAKRAGRGHGAATPPSAGLQPAFVPARSRRPG